ncbi:MAG: cache domain-containing protein [Gemmatimonadota bacterium]
MGIRGRLNLAILAVFVLLATAVALTTVVWVDRTVVDQAAEHVALNIRSAWLVYDSEQDRVRRVAELLGDQVVWHPELRGRLHDQLATSRERHGLDLLTYVDSSGAVVQRSQAPNSAGDWLGDDPLVRAAMASGSAQSGTILLAEERLRREAGDLLLRCRQNGGEATGMMVATVVPLWSERGIVGYLQAGVLLNGAVDCVDRMRDVVFADRIYQDKPLGTATIFMGDLRIATNVRDPSGKRAMGTRVSREVAEKVLGSGASWTGRAWVVDAWYISQYDPIRDPDGAVIGILYIGELEERYRDLRQRAVILYLGIIGAGMAGALGIFFAIGASILRPVRELSEATVRLAGGDLGHQLEPRSQDEVGALARSFNHMARQLEESRREIEGQQQALMQANEGLSETNRNYMDMLGFVSHELRNPLASSVMMLETVREGYQGELTEGQAKALQRVDANLHYFLDMIQNYLDLSRLERGELQVARERVRLRAEVIEGIVEGLQGSLREQDMEVAVEVPEDLEIRADGGLLRIVYDNLLANAVKYGRRGGRIAAGARVKEAEVELWVQNEGEGIPAEHLPRLFGKFSRLEVHKRQGKKGTGLGLYICRQLVEKQGGRIWAESEPGQWARFTFTMPRA